MSSSPTLEHDRWKGNNSRSSRDSFRKSKYRSMDPISRGPMARASIFFSPDSVSPGGLLGSLGGRRRSMLNSGGAASPTSGDKALTRTSSSMRFVESAAFSPDSSMTVNKRAAPRNGVISFAAFGHHASNETATPQLVPDEADTAAKFLPPVSASTSSRAITPQVGGSLRDIVRMCPTPTAGAEITASPAPLHSAGMAGFATPTFAFPSLTTDPLLRRSSTPLCGGKTSIARLIAANRAFVGFEEQPIEDPLRCASALM